MLCQAWLWTHVRPLFVQPWRRETSTTAVFGQVDPGLACAADQVCLQ